MDTIYELSIYSRPTFLIDDDGIERIYGKIDKDLSLPKDTISPEWVVSDDVDSQNLLASIQLGELSHSKFETFCKSNGLPAAVENKTSANRFLSYEYGQCMFWLYIPNSSDGEILFKNIYNWVVLNNYVIQEEHFLFCPISDEAKHLIRW